MWRMWKSLLRVGIKLTEQVIAWKSGDQVQTLEPT